MVIPKKKESETTLQDEVLSKETISKILSTVSYSRAFFFYEEIGKPIGEVAVSLSDFCLKINTIPLKSLVFHLERGDFENWIRDIIGDVELASRISKIRAKKDQTAKKKLYQCVSDRIEELKEMWASILPNMTLITQVAE
jgi:hypothetical protein